MPASVPPLYTLSVTWLRMKRWRHECVHLICRVPRGKVSCIPEADYLVADAALHQAFASFEEGVAFEQKIPGLAFFSVARLALARGWKIERVEISADLADRYRYTPGHPVVDPDLGMSERETLVRWGERHKLPPVPVDFAPRIWWEGRSVKAEAPVDHPCRPDGKLQIGYMPLEGDDRTEVEADMRYKVWYDARFLEQPVESDEEEAA